MKTFTVLLSILCALVGVSCTESAYQVSSQGLQEKMSIINKTDYAKIDIKQKEKIEGKRQDEYHRYANDVDRKLNHNKNEQLNQKKGWDGSFGFY